MGIESYHVVRNPEQGWNVVRYNSLRASELFSDYTPALEYAGREARNNKCGLVIHDERGEIQNPEAFRYKQMSLPIEEQPKIAKGEPVYINCPYDSRYDPFLNVILFTVVLLGYTPRLALESSDASKPRLEKIFSLMEECKVSIHDISNIRAEEAGNFFRLNMAFELGLDLGCKKFSPEYKDKKFLIVGGEPYEYMKALSDLSGVDIKYHRNNVFRLIETIRHWFVENLECARVPGPLEIWYKYNFFNKYYLCHLFDNGFSPGDAYTLPLKEKTEVMARYIGMSETRRDI